MATWNLPGGGLARQVVTSAGVASAVSVVASGSAHTKGSWTEAHSSTTGPVTGLYVAVSSSSATSATDTSSLLDIGIGAAGSEVVVVADLQVGYKLSTTAGSGDLGNWFIPVALPSGVRISARVQSAVTSKSISMQIHPHYGYTGAPVSRGAGRVITYGANASTSAGVLVTSGTGAKGSWAEITSSTTYPVDALAVSVGLNSRTNQASSRAFALDIGIGAAGSEVVIIDSLPGQIASTEHVNLARAGAFPLIFTIPEGARLAARIGSAAAEEYDIILHAIKF